MSVLRQHFHQSIGRLRHNHRPQFLFFSCVIVAMNFSVCRLRHAALPREYREWRCEAFVRDTDTQERIRVTSDPPFNPLPSRIARRPFIMIDWDEDGVSTYTDVLTDWRRYIANNILRSPGFAGRSWCLDLSSGPNCEEAGTVMLSASSGTFPPTLATESLRTCGAERIDTLLEISAPGLLSSPNYRIPFPDTPIGVTSAPVVVTLRNFGSTSVRINGTDLLGAFAGGDFSVPASENRCLPTADEMRRGVGHELAGLRSCGFQVLFAPQFRPGVPECDRDDTTSAICARGASLRITYATIGGTLQPEAIVHLSGRAVSGRLVVAPDPQELCFRPPAVPLTAGMCTEERTITLSNDGTRATTGNLNITSATSTPYDSFLAAPRSLDGRTLAPGESVDVRVRYCESGSRSDGAYRIYSSSDRGPNPVEITIFNPNNRTCP